MLDSCKMVEKQSEAFHEAFFPNLKHNFIAYRSSKVSWCPDGIFEIHQLWQSGCIPIAAVAIHLYLKS